MQGCWVRERPASCGSGCSSFRASQTEGNMGGAAEEELVGAGDVVEGALADSAAPIGL